MASDDTVAVADSSAAAEPSAPAASSAAVPPPPAPVGEPRRRRLTKSVDMESDLSCLLCLDVKMENPDPLEPSKPIRLGLKRKTFFIDWYCDRVHQLKHKDKSPHKLAELLKSPTEMAHFMENRATAIALLQAGMGRLSAKSLPDAQVVHVEVNLNDYTTKQNTAHT